jgi:hypothetical protein
MNNLDTIEELDADTLSGLLNDLRRSDRHRPYAVIARAGRYVLCRGHVEALVGDEVRLLAGAPECTWEVSAPSCDALAGGVQRARVGAYGWHLSADGNSLIAFGPTPPTFTIKAWGKFRVLLRGPSTGDTPGEFLGELMLDVRSPHGIEDVTLCGTDAFDPRGPVGAHQRNLRRVEDILTSFARRLAALEGPRHVDSDATRRVLDDIEARLAFLEGPGRGSETPLADRVAALEASVSDVASVGQALQGANVELAKLMQMLAAPGMGAMLGQAAPAAVEPAPLAAAEPAEDLPPEVIVTFSGGWGMDKGQTATIHTAAGNAKVVACARTVIDGTTPMRLVSPAHPPLSTVVKLFDAVTTDAGFTGRVTKILG